MYDSLEINVQQRRGLLFVRILNINALSLNITSAVVCVCSRNFNFLSELKVLFNETIKLILNR